MKKINSFIFNSNNITDNHEKYFIYKWDELLSPNTIDSYRVRLMHSVLILKEAIEIIEAVKKEYINKLNIRYIFSEAKIVIEKDEILTQYYKDETEYLAKQLLENKEGDAKKIKKVEFEIKFFLSKTEKTYSEKIKSFLKDAIFVNKNYQKISKLTNILITDLISKGISSEYLFNKKNDFIRRNNNTFEERFDLVLDNVNQDAIFTVNIKFTTVNELANISEFNNIKLSDNLEIDNPDVNETAFLNQSGEFYATINDILAKDYYQALHFAYRDAEIFFDVINLEFRRSKILISPKALIKNGNETYLINITNEPRMFLKRGRLSSFQRNIDRYNEIISGKKVDSNTVERIKNSVRYYRMSLNQEIIETRFLQCWISLEFLYNSKDIDSATISKIADNLTNMSGIFYLKKLLSALLTNIVNIKMPDVIDPNLLNTSATKKSQLLQLYENLKDAQKVQSLKNLTDVALLHDRIDDVAKIFTDSNEMKYCILNHIENLRWNINRLYRARNKIVHSAKVGLRLEHLEVNLFDYYTLSLNNIVYHLLKEESCNSVDDIFNFVKAKLDYTMNNIEKNNLDEVILEILK